jgi:hypothetical protein
MLIQENLSFKLLYIHGKIYKIGRLRWILLLKINALIQVLLVY